MTEVKRIYNAPIQPTAFIGREEDLAKLGSMLTDNYCRLMTVTGPGGIGKTRLALQAAYNSVDAFRDGAYFVPLLAVNSSDALITAVIEAVRFVLQGHDDPSPQLLRHLRDKQLLLILDNFEHLVPGVEVLLTILESAPQVKFLITSREVLNLRQEWVLPLSGMAFPDHQHIDTAENFAAVKLFVECARRMRPDFSLEEERAGVAHICQIVEGVPLAIELAASWLKSLPCASIASEIQRNLDFLDTKLRDFPARHRSIRAVFDHSWSLLSPHEQSTFSCLAIFRGGFQREAAAAIAGASLADLSALIDKSLIRIESSGRYQIHELLRQLTEEKLAQQADLKRALRDQHANYYADFLERRAHRLSGGATGTFYEDLVREADNIAMAWDYALEQANERLIDRFLVPLYHLYNEQNRYYDGERIFRRALTRLAELGHLYNLTQARASLCLALCLQYLTRYDEAEVFVEKCFPVLEQHGEKWALRNAESCLANIAYSRGDYAAAQRHFERVRGLLTAGEDPSALIIALSRLSDLATVRGDYEAARQFLSESVAELGETGSSRSRIRFLITLGDIEHKIGNYEKAEAHFEAALSLSRSSENTMTHAISLTSLARVAYATGAYARAEALCQESITLFEEVRHLWGKAFALAHLARVAMALERFDDAQPYLNDATTIAERTGSQWLKALCYYHQGWLDLSLGKNNSAAGELHKALNIAAEVNTDPLILDILGIVAELAKASGDRAWAVSLCAYVCANVHTEFATRTKASGVLHQLKTQPEQTPDIPLSEVTAAVLAALESGFDSAEPPFLATSRPVSGAENAVDSLTEREREILLLLADGHSNQTIADQLYLGLGTVKAHNHNIFSKLGVNNRVQAITRARELRLI
jgi:predicted ATPase/DNA-binding CsgD family transcriptional regulator